eukprot:TRINITY_DN4268_c0_g2_i1.p1 TRINITY_DN4268_c0_g2~~TRINITY_DN4268_c0_g2_i1.p1  ORF type:complete len:153 (+),score=33.99 TRINITY_DN4268_c0_g2_i1:111-569(+)
MTSFERLLSELLDLKRQAIHLYQSYSPEINNLAHLENVEEKTRLLTCALRDMDVLKQHSFDELRSKDERLKEKDVVIKQLRKENASLAEQTLELKRVADNLEIDLKSKEREIETLTREKTAIVSKHRREIENLRLMHSQELYILKSSERKVY